MASMRHTIEMLRQAIQKQCQAVRDLERPPSASRRRMALASLLSIASLPVEASQLTNGSLAEIIERSPPAWPAASSSVDLPNYSKSGPYQAARLPVLEHTCASCFPDCNGDKCIVRLMVSYPKGYSTVGLSPPFPLVIFTPGFLIKGEQYLPYADRLASWGFCCIIYDKREQALDPMTDILSIKFLREVLDWSTKDPLLTKIADTSRVMLVGHSRGAKISTLAAIDDPRVAALFLIDPVDVTIYAPLSAKFPSAVQKLKSNKTPIAVIGSGLGGDCVPKDSNYNVYYEAASGPAWLVEISNAGHLQYLKNRGSVPFDNFCVAGSVDDSKVVALTQSCLVAWAECWVRDNQQPTENSSSSKRMRMGVNKEGELVAGVPSFDPGVALFSTEGTVQEKLLQEAGLEGLKVKTHLKNSPSIL